MNGNIKRKPEWLRTKLYSTNQGMKVEKLLRRLSLNTVCSEARCPNIGECYNRKTATFMILGSACTRNCRFCNVHGGEPETVDLKEPEKIAEAVTELGLRHVVITSVTRDDLEDGGAGHFAKVIECIRALGRHIVIEVLIPDFGGNYQALTTVIKARPDVINHNVETVPRLYLQVRPMAIYERSLELLKNVRACDLDMVTKSGFMLGLGETKEEVLKVMEDLRTVECDILTIGQYLQPSKEHYPVKEYIRPEVFESYKEIGNQMGFRSVASGPLVRSSYLADVTYNRTMD
ncbi:lipoic acid synthetase [Dethiosulfatibacter aminovorans DSM 17477]|uniref:Lipoyl synthase n=1 Tax=Dethiosulfatibacter aminovorans DSM 17477 TaxID=1121476 RepID=A0A1M6JPD9_9FIRM|nr:lipoyl synthase [Dethiosulfatibacter aminovorans]SHJ48587.1 lipoic acid synthetase [Dethiosulfatibacter aminovorans DSM 17477]